MESLLYTMLLFVATHLRCGSERAVMIRNGGTLCCMGYGLTQVWAEKTLQCHIHSVIQSYMDAWLQLWVDVERLRVNVHMYMVDDVRSALTARCHRSTRTWLSLLYRPAFAGSTWAMRTDTAAPLSSVLNAYDGRFSCTTVVPGQPLRARKQGRVGVEGSSQAGPTCSLCLRLAWTCQKVLA